MLFYRSINSYTFVPVDRHWLNEYLNIQISNRNTKDFQLSRENQFVLVLPVSINFFKCPAENPISHILISNICHVC